MDRSFENALNKFDIKTIKPLSQTGPLQFSKNDIIALTKLISQGHPGFIDFPKGVQSKFLSGMKKIYKDDNLKTPDAVWKVLEILPDSHLQCSMIQTDGKEKCLYFHDIPKEEYVGKNLLSADEYGGIKYEKVNGKTTAVVMMPNTGNLSNLNKVTDFLDAFDNMMKRKNSIDNIILDVRGNPGGATCVHEYIARQLCGNEVSRCETETTRATKESAYILASQQEIPASEQKTYSKREKFFADGRGYLIKYPSFQKGGFEKPIYILQNRETASAGEAFIYMMRNHPNTITLGSNTSGCVTYPGRKKVFLANGFGVKIPFSKQTFANQNGKPIKIERNGLRPDITLYENAYDFVTNPDNTKIIENAIKRKKAAIARRFQKEKADRKPEKEKPRIFAIKELTQHNDDIKKGKMVFRRLHPDLSLDVFNSLVAYAKKCKN